jgi:hypothetical protein
MGRIWRSAAASVLAVGLPTPTGGEAADLDRVVGEDAVSTPDLRTCASIQPRPVPAVAALEVADSAFGSGSPLDQAAEASSMFDLASRRRRLGLAGNGHGAHAVRIARASGSCRLTGRVAPSGVCPDSRARVRVAIPPVRSMMVASSSNARCSWPRTRPSMIRRNPGDRCAAPLAPRRAPFRPGVPAHR